MSIVGAYIEIHKESNFHWGADEPHVEGQFYGKNPGGLEVEWAGDDPPAHAHVYLYWEPKVVAVWSEEEIIDGEDREGTDGSDVEQRDEAVPAEPDLGSGEGGLGERPRDWILGH